MIINENILKKYLLSIPSNLKELINNHIIEVESNELINPNQQLIIGEILEFKKIPNTYKLNLVQVNIGKKVLSIVCGASNLVKKKKVIAVQSGTYLTTIKTLIEKKTIFDVESDGMICSAEEIGLNIKYLTKKEKEGILLLDDDAQVGQSGLEYLKLKGFFFELALTPNKADLLSHIGFAKDLAAISSCSNNKINFITPPKNKIKEKKEVNPFQIKINNDHCLEYNMRYITDVKVTTSALWLRNILSTSHIKPVNNVVDVINLVMIEYGIPIIAFDASQLKNTTIEINKAISNQKVIDSEKKEYLLNKEDLVITNDKKIISIAGLINSAEYNINSNTKEIILSTALFQTENIFKTSKRLNLQNENALRFKRGIDQQLLKTALNAATSLLQELSQVSIYKNMISINRKIRQNPELTLSLEDINQKTGIYFSKTEVLDILKKLDYQIKILENNIFQVVGPSRRYDTEIYEDVISDLIRIRGYHNMNNTEQSQNKTIIGLRNNRQQTLYKLRNLLANLGFMEIKTYSLLNKTLFQMFFDNKKYVKVIKPISHEKNFLRQYLSPNMVEVLSFNQKNNNMNNAFFEIGKVYYYDQEIMHLSLGLSGVFVNSSWLKKNIESSFFVLKGILERIKTFLNINLVLEKTSEYSNLHPGRQANIFLEKEKIGFIGETHPNMNNTYHLKKNFLLEFALKDVFFEEQKTMIFKNINKLPSITRDLSFLINQKYNFEEISFILQKEISDILVKCDLLDLYQNKNLSSEEYSLSFRFTFKDDQQNLTKDKVEEIMNKIENKLKNLFQVQIR
jgi:phenylalanyl-tRNA synthetase beta chain